MFRGFNLASFAPAESFVTKYKAEGQAIVGANETLIRGRLAELIGSEPTLDGSGIQGAWFPQVNADVFICHSHQDLNAALALAGWLKRHVNLKAFVDSSVWGYADELLKIVDTALCLNPGGETYDYNKRNESTSHVHMMLVTALGTMIDRTECLFFLNTPRSITSSNVVAKTQSPWIYAELTTAGLVRETTPNRHLLIKAAASRGVVASKESLKKIEYSVPQLKRLEDISPAILADWAAEAKRTPSDHVLDVLYRLVAEG